MAHVVCNARSGNRVDDFEGVGVLAGKKQLPPVQVVREGDEAPPASISAALGDRLNELRSLRRVMAAHLDSENILARDLAALSRQFRRSEEHTSELQSRGHLVCRLLLEKKNKFNLTRYREASTDRI